MNKTAQHELALSLDELDTVVGGGGTPTGYFRPVAIQANTTPGSDFASTSAVLSAANNYGLAGHFDLSFPTMVHGTSHAADGTAPSVPGSHDAPAVGADDRGALSALPLSLLPVPGQLSDGSIATTPAAATPDASTATTDASTTHYFGLPGGTDTGHAETDHAATNNWAPGSFGDSTPASFAPNW